MSQRLHVLLVDDSPITRRAVARVLEVRFHVVSVEGPSEALAHLSEQPFDVVVTDFCMPERDGLWLLGRVRELHPEVGRVLVSATPREDVERLLDRNVVDCFVPKGAVADHLDDIAACGRRGSASSWRRPRSS